MRQDFAHGDSVETQPSNHPRPQHTILPFDFKGFAKYACARGSLASILEHIAAKTTLEYDTFAQVQISVSSDEIGTDELQVK